MEKIFLMWGGDGVLQEEFGFPGALVLYTIFY